MSPGVALGYLFWTRHRRGLMVVAGYLLIVVLFCRGLFGGAFASTLDQPPTPGLLVYALWLAFLLLCFGLAIALAYLLCIFAFSREVRRFEGCESGFPSRLRHLPLPALALAGWPMLWGSATMMLGWLVLAWGAFRPCGYDVPLGWPALLLAVVLAWLQAIIWTPFPLPWVRALLFFPVSCVLVCAPMAMLAFEASALVGYLLLAGLLPAAYWTAIRGVSRARRGENEHWSQPASLSLEPQLRPRPPFPSAARAQLWFEWQRGRIAFPLGCALSWLAILVFIGPWSKDEERLLFPYVLLISGLCLATTCGALIGEWTGQEERKGFSSFIATRPISTGMLARVKFEAAMLSSLAGWAGMLVGLMVWLALSGHGREIVEEQITAMRQHYPVGQSWLSLTLLVCSSVVLIWMQMAGTLWVMLGYRGDGGRAHQPPFLQTIEILGVGFIRQIWSIASVLGILAVSILIFFDGQAVRASAPWQTFIDLLPGLAGGAIILKSLAAAWSLSRLKRKALVPAHVLIGAIAVWSVLALSLLIALRWLIPREVFPTSGLMLGLVALLPLTRLVLVPLALSWNRHR